jgi:hypothetical protein
MPSDPPVGGIELTKITLEAEYLLKPKFASRA